MSPSRRRAGKQRDLDTARQWGRELLKTHELLEFATSDENSVIPVIGTTELQADAQPRKMSISGIVNSAVTAGIIPPAGHVVAGSGISITQSGSFQVVDNSIYSVGDLSDVDTTTVSPSGRQALVWDDGDSQFKPTSVVNSNTTNISGSNEITNMVSLTQAQYDAIATPDSATFYIITA